MSAADSTPASREALLQRPLLHNKLWADVTPIKQDDGEAQGHMPVVPINYPAHYSDVMDLFRGVLRSGELSRRTLLLTEAVIDCNSANYSAWHYRRLCLDAVGSDLREELAWVATVALDTPKNYQLWHHRRCLLEKLDDLSLQLTNSEIGLTAQVLELDAKNYHAWSHRQWCLKFFTRGLPKTIDQAPGSNAAAAAASASPAAAERPNLQLFAQELEFIDSLLQQDVRNNSAWNQRFFVQCLDKSAQGAQQPSASAAAAAAEPASAGAAKPLSEPSFTQGMSADVIQAEISYCGSKLLQAPHNESPWNYLEGLMKQASFEHHQQLLEALEPLDEFPESTDEGDESLAARCAVFPNRFAQSLLVELWDASPASMPQAKAAALWLAKELDPIRQKYWEWRAKGIEQKMLAL